ncbi:hypothetical protein CK934_19805 [Chitinophaga sp. MD30]|nr:hypothetical protein CK934_19805 [Chitinophaga sp. MD30]
MLRKRYLPTPRDPKMTLAEKRFKITYELTTRGMPKEFVREGAEIALEHIKIKRTTIAEAIEFVIRWIEIASEEDQTDSID